jgi:hypothetical protein
MWFSFGRQHLPGLEGTFIANVSKPLCPPGSLDTLSTSQNVNVTSGVEVDEESLIDSIVSSSRQGRVLQQDGYNQVASDPQVRQAIEAGNDSEARHFIREKLCNLGLMAVSVTLRMTQPSYCHEYVPGVQNAFELLIHTLHKLSVKNIWKNYLFFSFCWRYSP